MFRSRRSSFLAASVLLLAACGGGGDSADRQRNEAIEELCTYSPTGSMNQESGRVELSFCAEAKTYTLFNGDGSTADILAGAGTGASFDPVTQGDRVEVLVLSVEGGFFGGAIIERVAVQVENDDSVTITKVEGNVVTSACLSVNSNELAPMSESEYLFTATVTCEDAKVVYYTHLGAGRTNTTVNNGRVEFPVVTGEQVVDYEVMNADWAALESGTVTLSKAPKTATIAVTGGSLAPSAEETTTTVEGSTEPPAEETTTTVEGAAAEETTTSAAGGGEMTLEEKWADCRNAPQVTFDKAEVERTGLLAYTVKWACLKYLNGENFDQMVSHSFNDGSFNYTYSSGDALKQSVTGDTFSYSGPIGAGTHDFSIGVSYSGFDHGWWDASYFDRYLSTFTVDPSVSTFATCRKDDIKVSRGKMTMDCDVTGLFELRLIKDWKLIKASEGSIDLSSLADGWNEGRLYVESGAVSFYVNGLYCATKCDEEQSSLKVERTIGEDNFWSFKVTRPSWCADPIIAWLHGYKYSTIARGVREEIDEDMFWDDLEFGMVVGPEISMVRVGDSRYWCNDPFGNWQTEAVWADYIITGDPAETPETTTTLEAPATTAAPGTTVPAGPVTDVPVAVLVPQSGAAPAEIQVPSNAAGLGVSAASIEAILSNAKTDVPVIVATFDTGDKVALRRGRDAVLKVPAGAKSVTFTAFKKDGTKVESTATLVTVKPLVKVAIKDASSGGSGLPVLPIGAAVVVVLLAVGAVVVRRRTGTTGV